MNVYGTYGHFICYYYLFEVDHGFVSFKIAFKQIQQNTFKMKMNNKYGIINERMEEKHSPTWERSENGIA